MTSKKENILAIIIVMFLWTVLSLFFDINELFLPKIQTVVNTFQGFMKTDLLYKSTIYSFARVSFASIITIVLSLTIAILFMNVKIIKAIFLPVISFMRYIPITAFYPLLILWIGIDENMKITLLVIANFVYFLPTTLQAFNNIPKEILEASRIDGCNSWQTTMKIIFPYAQPMLWQSFLTMSGIGWTYVILAENINTEYGLGHLMNIGLARGKTDIVFVSLIIIIFISVLTDLILSSIIKNKYSWYFE